MTPVHAAVSERRRPVHAHDVAHIERRSLPAMYIIDSDLKVLHSRVRSDQRERRRSLHLKPQEGNLPNAISETVRELIRQSRYSSEGALAVQHGLVVRVAYLDSIVKPAALAVFVERYKGRDYLKLARERFKLTKREVEVLELLIGGARTKDIAHRLVIAQTTAIFHVKKLLEKTSTRTRLELISKALA